MAATKFACKLKISPTAQNICARTGITWTIADATDELVEKLIKAGNKSWAPIPAEEKKPKPSAS